MARALRSITRWWWTAWENRDAAWYYAEPKEKAAAIKGRVAFWKGVTVG